MTKKKMQEEEVESKQLDLEIEEPFKNKFYKAKRKFDTAVLYLEVRKFLKDPLVWAVLIIGGVLIYYQIDTIKQIFDTLPKYLPILRFYTSPSKQLIEAKYIYIIPILTGVLPLISMAFISRNYNREKNLVKLLLVSSLIFAIFLTIALLNIVSI